MSTPMIIDTDPGADDAVALMLAAADPEVELLAVTTVFGNAGVEVTTANALRLRALAGLGHVPVAAGAGRPLVRPRRPRAGSWHGPDGLGGGAQLLAQPAGPVSARGAVALMAGQLVTAPAPVTLVAIGPLTNIALLLAAYPEVKPKINRIVAMGGHIAGRAPGAPPGVSPPEGSSPAEFNIRSDPEAARRVLVEEDVPATLVPLDLTRRVTVDGAWLDELAAAGPRCAALAGVLQRCRAGLRETTGQDVVPLHDALAVLEAAVPGTVHATPMSLRVRWGPGASAGGIVAGSDDEPGRVVQVALDADLPSLSAAILNRLRALR